MAAQSFPVGQAPWEQGSTKDPHPDSFPVGSAPWESQSSTQSSPASNSDLDSRIPFTNATPRSVIQGGLNLLPAAGLMAGGIAGAETGPGAIATAGLGYAGGEHLKQLGEMYLLGQQKKPGDIVGADIKAVPEGMTAEMGGQIAGKAISSAISSAPAIAKTAAKKIGNIFAYVPEDVTGRYIDDAASINNAPSRDQISDNLLNLKNQTQGQLENAQGELLNAKANLSENKIDTRSGLQDQKFQASQDLQQSQQAFNEKKQAFKEALKNNNLTSMASDVNDAIGSLKDQVIDGSKDAYATLFKASGTVETKTLVNVLQGHIDSMMVNGVPASSTAEQAINEIEAMQSRLKKMGPDLQMYQAKQVLQGLDKDITYSNSAGSFAPQSDQAFSDMRSTLDKEVKAQVPEYKQQMADVSRKARLLNTANDLYGTPEKAISNLNGITSQKGQAIHVPLLEALGKESGKDLSGPVNDYLLNQKILQTPSLFDRTIENLPEAKALRSAQSKMTDISNPAYSRDVSDIANVPFQNKITQAQASVDQAKTDTQLFSGVTPESITSKTKQLGGANNYGAESRFGPIDQRYGTDFQKQIQARNDLDAFSKEATRGSRLAITGGSTGAAIGYAVAGHEGALAGGAIGAQVGAAADKYAGQIFKYALDKSIPIAQAMKEIKPPPGVSAEQVMPAIIKAMKTGQPPSAVIPTAAAASNDIPSKGPEKWANDGLQKLKQHSNEDDKATLDKFKGAMMLDPKAREMLISASNFSPGSKALDQIMTKLKSKYGDKQ